MGAELAAALQHEGLFVGQPKESLAARLAQEGLTAADVEILVRWARCQAFRDPVRYVQRKLADADARAWKALLIEVIDWAKAERRWRLELQPKESPPAVGGSFHWPSADYVPTPEELDSAIVHHFRERTRITVESLAHFLETTPERVHTVLAREGLEDEAEVCPGPAAAQPPRRAARSTRYRGARSAGEVAKELLQR